ncbi:MAG: 6-phosphofructo-2-kinase/fructose-2,6-bisphosphatase [Sorangiineae bacterium]|nr:6-phosphofructo-2-kinase/fructose-2,6-bisphosphatase [Sorangiineae bacterium]MEB2343335.1 6-phosphofructo-2-kinase/fructose-2,6-bisphosphatase [Deltaproteobacteria bacterium]
MIRVRPEPKRLALVMVGLPARGKTYVGRKLGRYLAWLGYRTQIFNVGDYRRRIAGARQPAEFFSSQNVAGHEARERAALEALDDLLAFFASGGEIGVYDATNTERARRDLVYERCRAAGAQVVFIESICEDQAVVDENVRANKLRSPDYAGVDPEEATRDFRARIAEYERTYQPVSADERSYVKLIDVGRQVVVNRIEGYLEARIIFFLLNLHPARRHIYLTRHGESRFNVQGRIGGDTGLSERGLAYARSLAQFVREQRETTEGVIVWSSTLKRALRTAETLDRPLVAWRALDEIDAGVCDGLTYVEIAERLPDEYGARALDKLRYRYPRGESYADVIQRLEPVIIELERQHHPILVISHQAVLRALYGYLMGKPQAECPHLSIPLHTVIELTPTAYGYEERRIPLEPPPLGPASSSSSS